MTFPGLWTAQTQVETLTLGYVRVLRSEHKYMMCLVHRLAHGMQAETQKVVDVGRLVSCCR
jgi:hypothetical protein